MSCDEKSMIIVGRPAVSLYHQLKKYYVAGDDPDYSNHAFPTLGYQICPSGYMIVNIHREASRKIHRDHIKFGNTGPLRLLNHACMFHQPNSDKHVNDLVKRMMVIVTSSTCKNRHKHTMDLAAVKDEFP